MMVGTLETIVLLALYTGLTFYFARTARNDVVCAVVTAASAIMAVITLLKLLSY